MSAPAILASMKAAGLSVKAIGGRLDIEGPEAAIGTLPLDELRKHKGEIIALLSGAPLPAAKAANGELPQALQDALLGVLAEQFAPPRTIATVAAEQAAPLPGIDTLEERAALISDGCGISQSEAAVRAAAEFGFADPDAFYRAHIEAWREAAAAARPLEQDRYGGALLKVRQAALDFLDSPHALEAARCGWGELALFGVHEGEAALDRLDARGLLPLIAWTVTGLKLESISRLSAGLTSTRGATLHYPRFRHSHHEAIAWWLHPRFGASTATAQTKGY
jgi:hypothetical protein